MKKLYLSLLLMLMMTGAYAQDFAWAVCGGSWAYDYGYGACTDNAGNIYVAGKFEMDGHFGDVTLDCAGNHDVYLAKYNPDGQLIWIRTGGGDWGDYAKAVTCDAAGNVYIAGEIDGEVMFENIPVHGKPGGDDAFVAKYDTDGNLQWVKGYGGYNREDARSIAVDAQGYIYICGVYRGVSYFGNETLNGTMIDDVYAAKLDPQGNVIWARGMGGPDDDTGRGITVDNQGNTYVTGGFIGTASFGPFDLTAYSPVYHDLFLVKLNSTGNFVWVKQAGAEYDDIGWAITSDNSYLYLTGEFNGNASFGPLSVMTNGNVDAFAAKYDYDGNAVWVKRFGSTIIDKGRGIATDGNKVYITGQFAGTVTHGTSTITAADSSDIFAAGFLASDGSPLWAVSARGSVDAYDDLGFEAGTSVAITGNYVYVAGAHLNGDTLGWTNLPPWSRTDMFLGKVDPSLTVGQNEIVKSAALDVYPNPSAGAIKISYVSGAAHLVTVINSLGQVVYSEQVKDVHGFSKSIDLSGNGKGIYTLCVEGDAGRQLSKVIIY
jgi:hypothetical protein